MNRIGENDKDRQNQIRVGGLKRQRGLSLHLDLWGHFFAIRLVSGEGCFKQSHKASDTCSTCVAVTFSFFSFFFFSPLISYLVFCPPVPLLFVVHGQLVNYCQF